MDPQPGIDPDGIRYRIWTRVVLVVFFLYIISILDRINIGYAALTMGADLGLNPYTYGLISGIFFIGYILFEVPSNILLSRVGARTWLARIMVSWGIVAVLMGFCQTPLDAGILRFLLGFAEAGFAPGIIYYLSFWLTRSEIAKAFALFFMAIPVTMMAGGAISGIILTSAGGLGLSSWRWLFILEGIPAIVAGIGVGLFLIERPDQARWLNQKEREWLAKEVDVLHRSQETALRRTLAGAIRDRVVILFCLLSFAMGFFHAMLIFWFPLILEETGLASGPEAISMLLLIPYGLAVGAMLAWSHHSDCHHERRWHIAIPLLAVAATSILLPFVPGPVGLFLLLSCAVAACYSAHAPFWSMVVPRFHANTRAAGIALVASAISLGSFTGPVLFGIAGGKFTGSAAAAIFCLFGIALAAVCTVFLSVTRDPAGPANP